MNICHVAGGKMASSSFSVSYSSTTSSLPVFRTSQAVVFSSTSKFHTLTPRSSSYGKSLSTKAHASSDNKKLYVENVNCSSKVTIIGSSLGIGPALSTSLKKSPLVSTLRFYSMGSADPLKACLDATLSQDQFSGLEETLKDTNVVVIDTPFPKAEGTLEDNFIANAMMVRACVEEVAGHCPDAFIIISNRMLNSIVPIMSAEVLKQRGVYDPKKLFGLMTPETELARAFVAERFVLDVEDVHVPVIGGHCSLTALPLFSKTTPHVILYKDDIILWTSEITYSINNSSEYLDYFAGNPDREYFEARGAERFVLSLLRALGGANDMFQCCFVESNMFDDIPFFGSTVKLGKKGVEAIIETDLEGLTEYEVKSLKYLKEDLIEDIEKGIEFAKNNSEVYETILV